MKPMPEGHLHLGTTLCHLFDLGRRTLRLSYYLLHSVPIFLRAERIRFLGFLSKGPMYCTWEEYRLDNVAMLCCFTVLYTLFVR